MPKKAPTPPPPAVLLLIERELTERFLVEVTRYAERACGRLLSIEDRKDPQYAMELVHAAIVDTCDGIRSWDPARVTLRRHFEQTINSRVWHECERARRRRHVAFDAMTDSQDENAIAVEMSLRHDDARARPEGRLAQRDVRERLFAALRMMAAGDAEVMALLRAYEAGDVRRDEAVGWLGWEVQTYVNVRRRLDRMVRRIPGELRAAVIDVLTRDGGSPLGVAGRRVADMSNSLDGAADMDGSDDAEAIDGDQYDVEDPT